MIDHAGRGLYGNTHMAGPRGRPAAPTRGSVFTRYRSLPLPKIDEGFNGGGATAAAHMGTLSRLDGAKVAGACITDKPTGDRVPARQSATVREWRAHDSGSDLKPPVLR
eukprot:scaffold8803_cov101-Isochrysis_galbana.AAC.2